MRSRLGALRDGRIDRAATTWRYNRYGRELFFQQNGLVKRSVLQVATEQHVQYYAHRFTGHTGLQKYLTRPLGFASTVQFAKPQKKEVTEALLCQRYSNGLT